MPELKPNANATAAPMPSFARVQTRRAFEAVCDQIRLQVASGKLAPGDRLPSERELAEQFGISRSGVREALRSLEMAGIVRAQTGVNGGFFIKRGHSEGITQAVRDMVSLGQVPMANVTEARIELMGVAVRLACERATLADLDAIEADIDSYEQLIQQGQASRNSKAAGVFYRLLAGATHNEVIVMLVDALSEIVRTLLARIDPVPWPEVIAVRRSVLAHLRKREATQAIDIMTAHLERLNDYLEEQGRAHGVPPGTSRPPVSRRSG